MANPSSTNAGAAQTRTPAGQPNAGFGWINTSTTPAAPPRAGTHGRPVPMVAQASGLHAGLQAGVC